MSKEYKEACMDRIIRPQNAKQGAKFDEWITSKSPIWQRRAVVQMRRYQSLECKDGMDWREDAEGWDVCEAYAFLEDHWNTKEEYVQQLIGAAGFSSRTHNKSFFLNFCWIHPFWRKMGLLGNAWPKFIERYGDFPVPSPSKNMKSFLTRNGWSEGGKIAHSSIRTS